MDEDHPGNPSTPYAASKLAGDHVVLSYRETYGIDASILRPFNNYGPRQNAGAYAGIIPIVVGRASAANRSRSFGDGQQTRDFVFVRDTAEAAVRAYESPATRGLVINVGSGAETTINALVRALLKALEVEVPVVHTAPRSGDVRRHLASIERLKRILGFMPGTELGVGLAETVAWYRSQSEEDPSTFDPLPIR